MNERFQTASVPRTEGVEISDDARRVLRNTWNLLSLTLLFCAGVALVSMANNWPHPGLMLTLIGYFGLLFLTYYLRNSAWGLLSVFALTGFMGLTLGPIVSHYLTMFSNGHQLVGAAFGLTGVAFVGLSGFAMVTKKDFSFMGPFLFVGILVAFLSALGAVIFQHGCGSAGGLGHVLIADVRSDHFSDPADRPGWRAQLHHGYGHPVRVHLQPVYKPAALAGLFLWRRLISPGIRTPMGPNARIPRPLPDGQAGPMNRE